PGLENPINRNNDPSFDRLSLQRFMLWAISPKARKQFKSTDYADFTDIDDNSYSAVMQTWK
ncbi:MAG: hypothetical protein KAS40_00505, partial [Desulfobacterales bacterium]|nr:hypothetical protein [Desulfobacterales bacterium]MCK5203933.1 hypothetical protein [Desulfobacterales bacterium]